MEDYGTSTGGFRSGLAGLVVPQRCVVCELPVSSRWRPPAPAAPPSLLLSPPPPVCAGCVSRLQKTSGDCCPVCGVPLVSQVGTCLRCRDRELSYDRHISIFPYAGVAKQLIIAYKFGGRRSLAAVFAPFLAEGLSELSASVLVPVPPSRKGKRRRGWDQVEGLARELRRLKRVEIAHILRRRAGREQKRLDFHGRSENLLGAIRIRTKATAPANHVVLLDDVFTTGATINECARVLRSAGVERVDALTLAAD